MRAVLAVVSRRPAVAAADESEDWAEKNRKNRMSTEAFARSLPSFLLVLTTICLQLGVMFLSRVEKLASTQ